MHCIIAPGFYIYLMTLISEPFGTFHEKDVGLYTIEFSNHLKASITNFGGIITSLFLPDKYGKMENVVLGYNELNSYIYDTSYLGAISGRFCNRIEAAKFSIDGHKYKLAANTGSNHLHGGVNGFNKKVWDIVNINESSKKVEISLKYVSVDGEEGYPGTLKTIVTYIFTPDSWQIEYKATTDKATIINLTQHAYFNLSGDLDTDILDHEIQLNAKLFLPINRASIPTGELQPVEGTPFDFTSRRIIGTGIDLEDQQLKFGSGYDHCWVLDGLDNKSAGSLSHPNSGRLVEVFTSEPGIQFYSGNFLKLLGKDGKSNMKPRSGLCLETQHFPNSPNQRQFPDVVLRPNEEFNSTTTYKFSVK
jgi:aldose 1-epimerase